METDALVLSIVTILAAVGLVYATWNLYRATGTLARNTDSIVRSENKRESIGAARTRQAAWQIIAEGYIEDDANQIKFVAQGSLIWGDERWHQFDEIARNLSGKTAEDIDFTTSFIKLTDIGKQRVIDYSKIIEDMERRSLWTFPEVEAWPQPEKYTFHVLKHYGDPRIPRPT